MALPRSADLVTVLLAIAKTGLSTPAVFAELDRLRERPDHVVMAPAFERELEQPLAGCIAELEKMGLPARAIRSQVRTGDTLWDLQFVSDGGGVAFVPTAPWPGMIFVLSSTFA